MYDLLSPQPFLEKTEGSAQMAIGEDENGVYVKGLSQHLAQTEEEALNLLFEVSPFNTHTSNTQSSNTQTSKLKHFVVR